MSRRDFTLSTYSMLLDALQQQGYLVISYSDFLEITRPAEKFVILRHDVDAHPARALDILRIEQKMGLRGTWYLRSRHFNSKSGLLEALEAEAADIGYHYENLSKCKGNYEKAYADFVYHLNQLNTRFTINSICMHGSPLSRYDNKKLWRYYSYRSLGIKAELYLDTDFTTITYLTDTGRCWNSRASIRDRVSNNRSLPPMTSFELMRELQANRLPPKLMLTVHPQRWSGNWWPWLTEWAFQRVRNSLKKTLWKFRLLYEKD